MDWDVWLVGKLFIRMFFIQKTRANLCLAFAFSLFIIICRYYGDILRCLYPLFGESEPDDAVRDNAAGAVARMILVHPESVPLNQVDVSNS